MQSFDMLLAVSINLSIYDSQFGCTESCEEHGAEILTAMLKCCSAVKCELWYRLCRLSRSVTVDVHFSLTGLHIDEIATVISELEYSEFKSGFKPNVMVYLRLNQIHMLT